MIILPDLRIRAVARPRNGAFLLLFGFQCGCAFWRDERRDEWYGTGVHGHEPRCAEHQERMLASQVEVLHHVNDPSPA